ncbi:DUF4153 domain-containing protein [Flammeovirga sp. MY04]|uniref:DUF4153 domain-containing protein n=1 Tax=Flammeovirga sp. MY04 TaxID=1191459 RepID=UPI0008258C8C|nr:DUF4153 domain-containing protein [Flammeovirga sp. MY04]ANQ50883.2 DUF4153 domain-containing protein [Flammeovirga sp. MY04]
MKSLSIQQLSDGLYKGISRFPLAILSAIQFTFLVIYGIETDIDPGIWYLRGVHGAQLGIPLFIALTFFAESKNYNPIKKIGVKFGGIALLLLYLLTLPETLTFINFSRFVLLTLFAHLLVFIAPSLHKGYELHFWVLAKEIILTFIECVFYAFVIGFGIFVAISAVHFLFDININNKRYAEVMSFCLIFLTTIFFAGRMQGVNSKQNMVFDYPEILKNFTQFILIPLVLLYLIILYIYGGQILMNQDWPKGWVSYLSIGFSVLGIVSIILIYPVRNDENNKWIPLFNKGFLYTLFPIIFLFCAAIWRRISEYGITENRYYLIALGVWLFFISVYTLIKRDHFIKMIPMSLSVVCILSAFGPLSAFNVSKNSQLERLNDYATSNNWLDEDGYWDTSNEKKTPKEDVDQSRSIIKYLIKNHGYASIQPYLKDSIPDILQGVDNKYAQSRTILQEMKLIQTSDDLKENRLNFYTTHQGVDIKGYSKYFTKEAQYLKRNGDKAISISKTDPVINLFIENGATKLGTLIIGDQSYEIPFPDENEMIYKKKDFMMVYKSVNGIKNEEQNTTTLTAVTFTLFIN